MKEDPHRPVTCASAESGDMGLFIKSYTIGSAAGFMGPMVLVLADDTLGEDEFKSYKVTGISHVSDAYDYGYVVLTKTRAGNRQFYRWYLNNILCAYVDDVRTANLLGESRAFVSTDGESIQIDTFMEEDSANRLEASLIYQGKHSASYSAKGNAWDAGNYFKSTKKRTKHLHSETVASLTTTLRRNLDHCWRALTVALTCHLRQESTWWMPCAEL